MRKIIVALALFLPTLLVAAPKPANYSGKWTLVRAQSRNLPPFYAHVTSHALDVKQSADALDVHVTIGSDDRGTETFDFHYTLDGKEAQTASTIITPNGAKAVPTTLKAIVQDGGNVQITIVREIPMPGETFKATTVETWQLAPDGKSITIHRADDTPRGKMESDLAFVKE